MSASKTRTFKLDEDVVEVTSAYDEEIGGFVYEYPDFVAHPRITPQGRRWVNATQTDCQFADEKYGDCGSCEFYVCEKSGDLIGICVNEKFKVRKEKDA